MKAVALLLALQLACASQPPSPEPVANKPPPRPVLLSGQDDVIGGDGAGLILGVPDVPLEPRARVVMGLSGLSEHCNVSNVESVIERRRGAFNVCYASQVYLDPTLAGTVLATWRIGTDGIPSHHRLTMEGRLNTVATTCVERALRRMRFDGASGACDVRWWITFSLAPL